MQNHSLVSRLHFHFPHFHGLCVTTHIAHIGFVVITVFGFVVMTVFGFSFFLMALVVLILDENLLELGLEPAYQDFAANAEKFLLVCDWNGDGHYDGVEHNKRTVEQMMEMVVARRYVITND